MTFTAAPRLRSLLVAAFALFPTTGLACEAYTTDDAFDGERYLVRCPAIDSPMILYARCASSKTIGGDTYWNTELFVAVDELLLWDNRIAAIVDDGEVQHWGANDGANFKAVFVREPIAALTAMKGGATLRIRITERDGERHDATFPIAGIGQHLAPFGKCDWEEEATRTARLTQAMLQRMEDRRAANAIQDFIADVRRSYVAPVDAFDDGGACGVAHVDVTFTREGSVEAAMTANAPPPGCDWAYQSAARAPQKVGALRAIPPGNFADWRVLRLAIPIAFNPDVTERPAP